MSLRSCLLSGAESPTASAWLYPDTLRCFFSGIPRLSISMFGKGLLLKMSETGMRLRVGVMRCLLVLVVLLVLPAIVVSQPPLPPPTPLLQENEFPGESSDDMYAPQEITRDPTYETAQATECHVYDAQQPIREGWGAAYDVFSADHEVLLKATCTPDETQITVGNTNTDTYVYHLVHYWINEQEKGDTELQCNGELLENTWCVGEATAVIPTQSQYFAAYTCRKIDGSWKCGCRDTQCAESLWQLQQVERGAETTLILNSVGTFNGEAAPEQARPQTSFAPGEAIRYAARIENTGSSTVTASLDYLVTGPKEIFSLIDDIAIPPDPPEGGWSLYVTTTVPTDAPSGTYTLRVTMTINGQSSTKESSFTVLGGSEQPPAAPSNVQAEEITHEGRPSTKVSWTDNANNELGFVVVDQNRPQEYEAEAVPGVGATGSLIFPFVSSFCVYAYNDYGISDEVCTGNDGLRFPLQGYTPYTAEVSSVQDNSMTTPYAKDGIVLAFNGERGDVANGCWCYNTKSACNTDNYTSCFVTGFRNSGGTSFLDDVLNYNDTYLYYDGHPGYDYPALQDTPIYAPGGGTLCVATTAIQSSGPRSLWRNTEHCPRPVQIDTSWEDRDTVQRHTFYIIHRELQINGSINDYITVFLHNDDLESVVRSEVEQNGYTQVNTNQHIAQVGSYGANGANHVHLEVLKYNTSTSAWDRVDPYGDGTNNVLWFDTP